MNISSLVKKAVRHMLAQINSALRLPKRQAHQGVSALSNFNLLARLFCPAASLMVQAATQLNQSPFGICCGKLLTGTYT